MPARLLIAILLITLPAWAQKPASPPQGDTPMTRLAAMPADLAGFRRGNLVDYAVTANDPRLGASLGYRSPQASVGTVYLYDGGQTGIGSDRRLVDEQLQSAIADVRNGGQQRGYSVVAEQAASVQGMRCVLFGLRHPQNAPIEDGLVRRHQPRPVPQAAAHRRPRGAGHAGGTAHALRPRRAGGAGLTSTWSRRPLCCRRRIQPWTCHSPA